MRRALWKSSGNRVSVMNEFGSAFAAFQTRRFTSNGPQTGHRTDLQDAGRIAPVSTFT